MSDAVIMIPGIKGSQLINVNTHNFHPIWRDFRFNFNNVEDLELTEEFEGAQYEQKMEMYKYSNKQHFRDTVVTRMINLTMQEDGRCFETFRRINVFARK